ncbi:MAG: hypothetical protein ACLP07_11255 [Terracidiphilus sp.]
MGRSNALRGRWFQPGIPFYLAGTGESTVSYLHWHFLHAGWTAGTINEHLEERASQANPEGRLGETDEGAPAYSSFGLL